MLGYAGINHTIRERDPPLRCNRTMREATFEERGVAYASELALQNIQDLAEILAWNLDHGIRFYRCSSDLVPWNLRFDLTDLPDYDELRSAARECGTLIANNGMRLSFHPDYWCRLASDSAETRARSKAAVEYHAEWLDLMGLDQSPYYGINVHIGATYGDKNATGQRFREAIADLSSGARQRLTVENDDTESLWSVVELAELVDGTGVPVVFDYHHHTFTDRGLTYREGFERAASTWNDMRPATHYSEPARLHDGDAKPQAHAEYPTALPRWLREQSDVMIEADGKEDAVLSLR